MKITIDTSSMSLPVINQLVTKMVNAGKKDELKSPQVTNYIQQNELVIKGSQDQIKAIRKLI